MDIDKWKLEFFKKYLERFPGEEFVEMEGHNFITNHRKWGIGFNDLRMDGNYVSIWNSGPKHDGATFVFKSLDGSGYNKKDKNDIIDMS